MITQPPHDEVGRYEVQCSVGQKRDESAGPCTPDCDRRPAGAIDEAGVDGVKHGAAPARVNKGQGAAGRPLYEIAGVWIKRPDEMGSGYALRNADSPLERLSSWHRVRTGPNP